MVALVVHAGMARHVRMGRANARRKLWRRAARDAGRQNHVAHHAVGAHREPLDDKRGCTLRAHAGRSLTSNTPRVPDAAASSFLSTASEALPPSSAASLAEASSGPEAESDSGF